MGSDLQKAQTRDDRVRGSRKVKVTILASEWGSSNGGLSTINRELAIHLAKFPEVEITFFVPKCSQEDKKVALDHKVKIVEAMPLSCFDQLDWLCFPPDYLEIDIVVGHGVKLGKQAQVIKKSKRCKWVQVVHTDPEELGMFKSYSRPISKGEEKHKNEVELCEMADHVVGIGPKLSEAFRSYLSGCNKDGNVFDLTPGVFEEFETVRQVSHSDKQQRRVLVFGRGDVEDFELKGFDIAGKAIAALQDTRLVFVGARDGKHEEIAKRLIYYGVPARRLNVKGFVQDREGLKRLFQQADLAVMPSRTEGFGLTGLEAMSAGLPVLVSRNSGFGEALRSAFFGSSYVIDSDDPAVWTEAIQKILSKDRECRLEEAVILRDFYGRKYNWAKQIKELVKRMTSLTYEDSLKVRSSLETECNASERMEDMNEDLEGTSSEDSGMFFNKQMPSKIASHEGASSLGKEPLKNWSMQSILGSTFSTGTSSEDSGMFFNKQMPSNIASSEGASSLGQEPLKNWSMQSILGSTFSTGPSTEIDNKQRANSPASLYSCGDTSCSICFPRMATFATGNQNERSTSNESLDSRKRKMPGSSDNPDISTRHSYKGLSDEQQREIHDILVQQIGLYTKYRKIGSDEGVCGLIEHIKESYNLALKSVGVGSLEITFQCPSLESLESLWSDYQCGHLNNIAERYLVTDDIKKKLNVKNVRLTTTIEEANYRNCKTILMEKSRFNYSTSSTYTRADVAKAWRGPVHKAAIIGDYPEVAMLLEMGEDVDQRDKFSLTPLHLACWYGHESVVKLLLEYGANVNAEDKFQRTPLQKAERQNHHSIVQVLLKNGARQSFLQPVSLRRLSRKAFLQVDKLSGFNLLHAAVFEGQYDIVLKAHGLLECFVEVMELEKTGNNAKVFPRKSAVEILSLIRGRELSHYRIERLYKERATNNRRLTGMRCLPCNNDAEQSIELVLNYGLKINAPESDNDCSPLLQASRSSSSQFVKTLIDLGAEVNAQSRHSKETPLSLATFWNNYMALRLLLKHGADVNVQDSTGFTSLHYSVKKGDENLVRLLLKNNADVDIQDNYGYTSLHLSVEKGAENLVRMLVEHNADVNIQDRRGYTPLHLLACHSNIHNSKIVDLLVKQGLQNINICDAKGLTPLHLAVRCGNAQAVKKLIELGADVSVIKANKNDAVELERLKNEAESIE